MLGKTLLKMGRAAEAKRAFAEALKLPVVTNDVRACLARGAVRLLISKELVISQDRASHAEAEMLSRA